MTVRIQAAQTDEEFVRSKWHKDWIWLGHYRSASQDDNDFYYVRIGEMDSPSSLFTSKYESDSKRTKSWSAAAEFTRQREEEIAELREEIGIVDMMIDGSDRAGNEFGTALRRTLGRLQRDLTALLKGWREQEGGK
jgi:hypothetical protein